MPKHAISTQLEAHDLLVRRLLVERVRLPQAWGCSISRLQALLTLGSPRRSQRPAIPERKQHALALPILQM